LSAFANTKGGTVFIGVEDNGKVAGIQIGPESVQQWINQIKTSTYPSIIPDIEIIPFQGKTIVAISAISYPIKPISFKGKYYKRYKRITGLF